MDTMFPRMDDEERRDVCAKLEWEGGLEYLVTGSDFSDFSDVRDKRFHELREAYIRAAEELEGYLRYDAYLNECIESEDSDTGLVGKEWSPSE